MSSNTDGTDANSLDGGIEGGKGGQEGKGAERCEEGASATINVSRWNSLAVWGEGEGGVGGEEEKKVKGVKAANARRRRRERWRRSRRRKGEGERHEHMMHQFHSVYFQMWQREH